MHAAGACAWGLSSAADTSTTDLALLDRWLDSGRHASMDYMRRNRGLFATPSAMLEGVKTIISAAFAYRPADQSDRHPLFADYARGADYHKHCAGGLSRQRLPCRKCSRNRGQESAWTPRPCVKNTSPSVAASPHLCATAWLPFPEPGRRFFSPRYYGQRKLPFLRQNLSHLPAAPAAAASRPALAAPSAATEAWTRGDVFHISR